MAYQLLRTNIALTGNVKMCCYLSGEEISKMTLNPLSTSLHIIPQEVNLYTSNYGADVAAFYKNYSNIFYQPRIDKRYTELGQYKDIVDEDKFKVENLGECQYGLKRVRYQKNGKQLSIFAPVFINSYNEIPDGVQFELCDADGKIILTKLITFNEELQKYFKRSFSDINENGGDQCRLINLEYSKDFDTAMCTVRGMSVANGCMININSNLPQKLLTREHTLRLFNEYICNEFATRNIIVPHILNLCWYFDLTDIIDINNLNIEYGSVLGVNVRYMKNKSKIDFADINFNLYDIESYYYDEENKNTYYYNLLNYNHEYDDEEVVNNIRDYLVPTTSKWVLSDSNNNYIFNQFPAYGGFDDDSVGHVFLKDTVYQYSAIESEISQKDNNLSWMRYIYNNSTDEVRQTVVRTGDDNTSSTPPVIDHPSIIVSGKSGRLGDDLMYIYKYHPEYIHKYKMYDSSVVCNGMKYKFDIDSLPTSVRSLISGLKTDCEFSISYIDNQTSFGTTPELYILYKIDETLLSEFNVFVWIPFPCSYIYDSNNPDNIKQLTVNSIFKKLSPLSTYFVNVDNLSINYTPTSWKIGTFLRLEEGKTNKITGTNRYYGWIQPDFNALHDNKTLVNDFVFFKEFYDETYEEGESLSNGLHAINLKETEITTVPFAVRNNPEYKWFTSSHILNLPKTIVSTYSISDYKTYKVEDLVELTIKQNVGDTTYLDHIKNLYNTTIDVDNDRTKYIIKLILK